MVRRQRLWLGLLVWAAMVSGSAAAPGAPVLPDGRGYELVSPSEKHGTGVASDSRRTRASADGNALGFISLGAFADAMGTGVATDYVSERSGVRGTSGWTTHAITPPQSGSTFDGVLAGLEPKYVGEMSADLAVGVFFAQSPLVDDPSTASVPNLYRRTDLLSSGLGTYDLLTRCPLCDTSGTPLPGPTTPEAAESMRPILAWMSPDASHIAFESALSLTADTPPLFNRVELYEWDHGAVSLVGRVPRGGSAICDDVDGPPCVASSLSLAGQGASNHTRTPHVVSDGSDGHSRVFFTFPTLNGVTPDPGGRAGQLYLRLDGASTIQLNASERRMADGYAPAEFLDASADGKRAFFMTQQALTDDTPADKTWHIYMYDASKPASAPGHLTFINADDEPGDAASSSADGIVGVSDDGHYVYFITVGQIVSGEPLLDLTPGLYLWHDGTVRFIASLAAADEGDLLSSGPNWGFDIHQARVTPNGRWLLYRALAGGTRQLFLYGADNSGPPACVSCDPSGAPTTADATVAARTGVGATGTSWHENHALANDGSRVFFSTAAALVPEDVNQSVDVYEYDVAARRAHLISSGTSPGDSWFMDASTTGSDAFFTTSQPLVGWDVDQEYDVYDARVGGGLPEPPALGPHCVGIVCRGVLPAPPLVQSAASAVFDGAGNLAAKPKPRAKPCRRGFARKRLRGHLRCVKRARKRARRPRMRR